MIVSVVLFKREGTYFSTQKNKDIPFTDFYIRVNANPLIPIEVKYFASDKFQGRDPGYSGRVSTLAALARPLREDEELPAQVVEEPLQKSLILYKFEGTFHSADKNKDVPFVNLYLEINGGEKIPISVKYFKNDKFDGRDPGYPSRMGLLSGIALRLPEKKIETVGTVSEADLPL